MTDSPAQSPQSPRSFDVDSLNSQTGFDRVIGVEYTEVTPDGLTAELTLRPELHQPFGITHGGVYCAVIESAASASGAVWLASKGIGGHIVGVNNNTDFLRAISEGTVTISTSPIHRGRRQQLWAVEVTAEDGKLVARGQVRLQNLDA